MEGPFELAAIDYVVVFGYVAAILVLGFFVGRGRKSADDYFLAGRKAVWPMIGFGLIAVNLSGTSYIGIAGAGYGEGIAVWNYEWMATLVLAFFALFVLPFYLRSKISTVPEFLERRYDRRSRTVFSAFSVFAAMFIDSAGAMFAGAITLRLVFPEVPMGVLVVAVALLGGVYVILGGLRAVEITDTVQGILLFIAGGVIFALVFAEIGGTWGAVQQAAPEDGLTIAPPPDDDFLPWPGIFTGVLWLGLYFWATNHVAVQKVLSAVNMEHARYGVLFAGLMQLPLLFLLVLPGLMGRDLFPDLENPDQIWPLLAFEFLPAGIRGLVLAALVAALMSTLDSVLNGAASLVTNDFVKTRRPDISDRRLLLIGRLMVGVFMIVAALWAPQIAQFPTLVEYFQSFLGTITMPIVVVMLGGLFWRRATPLGAFTTMAVGFPVGLAAFIANELLGLIEVQFLYLTGILLIGNLAVFVAVSLLSVPTTAEQIREYTWSVDYWRQETTELRGKPWWRNHRVLAAALVALTLLSIIPFL